MRSRLQKEINSECPFCSNQEVAYFEVHHIDGNPSNSKEEKNLIMICRECHSKIEDGIMPLTEVLSQKENLANRSWKVEFVSVTTSETECGWDRLLDNEFAFLKKSENIKPFPILNFTFINHLSKTIILKQIEAVARRRSTGLSGIDRTPRKPQVLIPITKYSIQLNHEPNILRLSNPLEVPAEAAFLFQIEVYPVGKPVAVDFTFTFSSEISVKVPTIFLNCECEEDLRMNVYLLS